MVPLNTKSAFTLLQSPLMPNQLVKQAAEYHYEAVGLADQDVLYGLADFYTAAVQTQIKPILGLTVQVAGLETSIADSFAVTLFVENQTGYHHLIEISSLVKTNRQVLTWQDLAPFLSGLFVVLPAESELTTLSMTAEAERVQGFMQKLATMVELQQVFLGVELFTNRGQVAQLQQLSTQFGLRLVAFDQVAYGHAEDGFVQHVLQKIASGETIPNLGLAQSTPAAAYLRPIDQWVQAYEQIGLHEAVTNTDWIATHSAFEMTKSAVTLPAYQTPQHQSAHDYLAALAQQGLKARLQGLQVDQAVYEQRLAEELQIIDQLGFNDYFLIVWDVIDFAHRNKIRTGPGRGSAAGSLVAYTLWITDVDPIAYDLLFERFLNPERAQMPDIDIDIPDNRREDILQYLHQKYGHERVAQIITFSTLAMKAAIRDVARVFGLTPAQIDTLSKSIPNARDITTLAQAYEASQTFRNALVDAPVDGQLLFNTAQRIEGLPRNHSLHAAGVVLSANPLTETIPVQLGDDGRLVTQLTKNPVEALGLLKIDFLALSNLNILYIAIREIEKETHAPFNIAKVDLNDPATMQLFQRAQTNGIFQFESSGMKNMLRQLQPDHFEDLVAANALFRPGPMQFISNFIARKHGREPIEVPDESIAELVAPTYGIIVYQEQVMRMAQQFAGFTLGEADLLRRAMSKKDLAKIEATKADFVRGAIALGHDEATAIKVFSYVEPFAQYGFNRSHAVAYSKLAVQMAYLKTHYPLAFFKAVLNDTISDSKKVREYIAEAKAAGVGLLGPNINESWQGYSIHHNQLQMGLASIKGMRRDFREAIIATRQSNGAFKDLPDFINRLENKFRKVELFEPLVWSGAFDVFTTNRQALYNSLQGFIDAAGLAGESMALFNTLAPKIRDIEDYAPSERLNLERETLGVYLSGHPIEQYVQAIDGQYHQDISTLVVGQKGAKILLYVENVKVIRTKKGEQMAFVDGMDMTGNLSITVFARQFQKYSHLLQPENILAIYGNVEQQRGRDDLTLIAEQIVEAQTLVQPGTAVATDLPPATGQWFLRIPAAAQNPQVAAQFNRLFQQLHGSNPVLLVYEADDRKVALTHENYLAAGPEVEAAFKAILGQNNVVFRKN